MPHFNESNIFFLLLRQTEVYDVIKYSKANRYFRAINRHQLRNTKRPYIMSRKLSYIYEKTITNETLSTIKMNEFESIDLLCRFLFLLSHNCFIFSFILSFSFDLFVSFVSFFSVSICFRFFLDFFKFRSLFFIIFLLFVSFIRLRNLSTISALIPPSKTALTRIPTVSVFDF